MLLVRAKGCVWKVCLMFRSYHEQPCVDSTQLWPLRFPSPRRASKGTFSASVMARGANAKAKPGEGKKPSAPACSDEKPEERLQEEGSVGDVVHWMVGSLAEKWDQDAVIRARMRVSHCVTRWPTAKTKGIPSIKAIDLCCDPLCYIARLWCPLVKQPKAPPVPVLRAEAV